MFSIIMPVYNSISTLDAAINSILAQTRGDFELLIVDDGSTDGSYDRCVSLASQDSRIRVYQNPHGGVSAARNRGIDEATGDIMLFIDSDDYWETNLLEAADTHQPNVCRLFGFKTNFRNPDGTIRHTRLEFSDHCDQVEIFSVMETDLNSLFTYNMASPCNKFYDAAIIRENRIYFHTEMVYLEDLDFNIQYLKHCSAVHVVRQNLYNYNIQAEQVQILKRRFQTPYRNADILFETATQYVSDCGRTWADATKLLNVITGAYCREALSWMYGSDRATAKKYLKQLNHNEHFSEVLSYGQGKFNRLLRLTVKHGLLFAEKKMLKKRYW